MKTTSYIRYSTKSATENSKRTLKPGFPGYYLKDHVQVSYLWSQECALNLAEAMARCGSDLLLAKVQIGDRNWRRWLARNFKGSPDVAEKYMRLCEKWDYASFKGKGVVRIQVPVISTATHLRDS